MEKKNESQKLKLRPIGRRNNIVLEQHGSAPIQSLRKRHNKKTK